MSTEIIADIAAFPLREPSSGRRYTVLRLRAKSGLTGFGECGHCTSEDLARVREQLTGRPATSYATAVPEGPLAGAVNMALVDIVGKSCGAPVYRVLGGPTRHKLRALTTLPATEPRNALDAGLKAGFRAFRVPAPRPLARNQGPAYVSRVKPQLEDMRKAAGDDVDFVLGGGNRLTPGDASALAADLERFHLLWFDEPCPVTNLSAIAKIANERVVPLGFGASVLQPAVFQDLLRDGLIDVVRPDISVYGILQSRRIAAMAETYYTAVAPHHEGGPVATVAAMHLAASLPNFYIQHIPPCAAADRAMRQELLTGYAESVSDGFAALPGGPGLGIQINEQALEKFRERAA